MGPTDATARGARKQNPDVTQGEALAAAGRRSRPAAAKHSAAPSLGCLDGASLARTPLTRAHRTSLLTARAPELVREPGALSQVSIRASEDSLLWAAIGHRRPPH